MKKIDEVIEAALDFERDWTALVEEAWIPPQFRSKFDNKVAKKKRAAKKKKKSEGEDTPDFKDLVAGLLRGERLMAERRKTSA
jgi:hypothetical protein